MSPRARAADDEAGSFGEAPHPRVTEVLFGHAEAETALLAAYQSRRVPHAFLLVGGKGIGKATLAYRMARFVLAHPDAAASEVQAATSLAVPHDHPVARRIAAQAQSGLLALERTLNDKGVLRQQIAVDDVRRSVGFFGSTAGDGGWRIAVVDAVDELSRSSANALLKVLEEPPTRAMLLLVSHSAAKVPATLRSRCRAVLLRPLPERDVAAALAAAVGRDADDAKIMAAAAAADGSVARGLTFLDGDAIALRERLLALLDLLPAQNAHALHALGDALAGTDAAPLAAFLDTVNAWLAQRVELGRQRSGELGRLVRLAEAGARINAAAVEAETYNLERRPFVFGAFGLLAEALRD